MKIHLGDWVDFCQSVEGKRWFCYGCGNRMKKLNEYCENVKKPKPPLYGIDQDERKQGTRVKIAASETEIISIDQYIDIFRDGDILLVAMEHYAGVIKCLESENKLEKLQCYILSLIMEDDAEREAYKQKAYFRTGKAKIPKVIHYCWFGRKTIPVRHTKWIDEWKNKCPDYEIIRWDEDNYDVEKTEYVRKAYEAKKWAFVSDYARLDILYTHGGIYLDTDIEIIKPFDDMLDSEGFCGFEPGPMINFGIGFGAIAGNSIVRQLIDRYGELSGDDAFMPCTYYQTEVLIKNGLVKDGAYQELSHMRVYPAGVLCGKGMYSEKNYITDMTHAVHHYEASWVEEESEFSMARRIRRVCQNEK